jgi:hypothetical protein
MLLIGYFFTLTDIYNLKKEKETAINNNYQVWIMDKSCASQLQSAGRVVLSIKK